MRAKFALLSCMMCLAMLPSVANAAFVVSVDPQDLNFTGPGVHEVDLLLSFSDTGVDRMNTLSGLQIDISNGPNATVRQGDVPSGITGQFFPAFNVNAGDRFAWGGFGDVTIPQGPGVLLTTLTFNVTNNQDFTIGLNFVEATRGVVAIDGGVAGDRGIVMVPSTFTVNSISSIPEPSSLAFLLAAGSVCVYRRRKRR